ncbi:hypothetical protein DTO164E3_2723 [Paecilomyces variotii]|nr:hypothetical protein DTO164E3_2723 [Paecilomyces variotii]KAJ9259435.1 hypothetical protein DTO207G8_998 [Paecilomyces variotii]KAJ9286859.1 hypothetical protein DTO021C3_5591 [Paecilomyces variotii]
MHRIKSWAKAHASGSPLPTQNPARRSNLRQKETEEPAANSRDVEPPVSANSTGTVVATKEGNGEDDKLKQGIFTRMKNGSIRFCSHTKSALCHSWVNVLLVFVPVGIAVEAVGMNPSIIFAMNAVAIVPLAGLLAHATEHVASRLGDTVGALINVTFGNAVELIIFIIALVKNEIRVVQASLLGSILANLLLILGMAFLLGGLRFQEQIYNSTVTQMSACLLSLSVTSLLLPTAFHASWASNANADKYSLKVSRGTSIVLLLVYILYIVFQLKSHAYLYASIPQQIIDEESHPGVLADFMNSSDSSDSSTDDSDDSNTSWTTAKRIRRAMKHRKRRKSNSSKGTSSDHKSALRSQTAEATSASHLDGASSRTAADVTEDTRYDADDDAQRFAGPLSRDFGLEQGSIKSKKSRRKGKKHTKRHSIPVNVTDAANDRKIAPLDDISQLPPLTTYHSEPSVERKIPAQTAGATADDIRKRRIPFPSIPPILTNTVFSPRYPPTASSAYPSAGPSGIKRTNSLPVRAARMSGVGNAMQFARTAARTPNAPPTETEHPAESPIPEMSRTSAVVMLLVSTALVAVCAEFLVDAIPGMIASSNVSQAFIGLIILPIVGNAAEHVTAVSVATKNKMDLAIGVSVGSSIQIAIFVTPLVVILGWCMDRDMSLYFTLFETVCLFVTAFVVNFLVLDGRSNYLEGSLLIAAYVIIAVAAFYYPSDNDASSLAS